MILGVTADKSYYDLRRSTAVAVYRCKRNFTLYEYRCVSA